MLVGGWEQGILNTWEDVRLQNLIFLIAQKIFQIVGAELRDCESRGYNIPKTISISMVVTTIIKV